jgi:hypothetical protein
MNLDLRSTSWSALEAHPVDNLSCERVLAQDCYITRVLGTVMRVHMRAAMVKWSMNVKREKGKLAIDNWSEADLAKTMDDAMKSGRASVETMQQESARIHRERLPFLRESQRLFDVSEAKKAAVMHAFVAMRAEGKEVRHVGAIELLTGPQVTKQIALRVFLDKVQVERRTGLKEVMVELLQMLVLQEMVARKELGELLQGDGVHTSAAAKAETHRLRALGLGKQQRAATAAGAPGAARAPRAPRAARTPSGPREPRAPRARQPQAAGQEAEEWMSEEGSEDDSDESDSDADGSGSGSDSDGIDADDILQKEGVYVVEKILAHRGAQGSRQFLIKWKGYNKAADNTWEPEANVVEFNPKLVEKYLQRKQKEPGRAAPPPAPPPAPRESSRPARAGAEAGAAKARVHARGDASGSDLSEEEEEETSMQKKPASKKPAQQKPAAKKPAAKKPAAKPAAKRKVAPTAAPSAAKRAKGGGPGRHIDADSSDEEGSHLPPQQRADGGGNGRHIGTDSSEEED